jgi:hypothetical protein
MVAAAIAFAALIAGVFALSRVRLSWGREATA